MSLSTNKPLFFSGIKSTDKEVDPRIVVQCKHTPSQNIVVWSTDTGELLLLVAHATTINRQIITKDGTCKSQKFISIKAIINASGFQPSTALALLPFHALTWSDTTSYLAGHSKRTALTVFQRNPELREITIDSCEKLICSLYRAGDVNTTDEARSVLFKKSLKPELCHLFLSHVST